MNLKLKKSELKIVLFIIVAIIAVILVGVIAFNVKKKKNNQRKPIHEKMEVVKDTSNIDDCAFDLIESLNGLYAFETGNIDKAESETTVFDGVSYSKVLDPDLMTQTKLEDYILSTVTHDYYANRFLYPWFTKQPPLFLHDEDVMYVQSYTEQEYAMELNVSTAKFKKKLDEKALVEVSGIDENGSEKLFKIIYVKTDEGWRINDVSH